jgi:VanZ family protein
MNYHFIKVTKFICISTCFINNVYKYPITRIIMDKKYQKTVLTCILIVYAFIMIIGAIIPNPEGVPVFSGNTKIFHFLGFIVLSVIVFKTFELYRFKYKKTLSSIALIIFIILTEVLQLLVHTRHFSYKDMLIDAAGCLIGFVIYKIILRYNK